MLRFNLTHSQEGTALRLERTPVWAVILEELGDWAARAVLPGHRLCCDLPEWTWKVGWGEFDSECEMWEHSLGQLCRRFSCWIETGFGAWRQATHIATIPVEYDWVQQHFPEMGSPWVDGYESDDMMESRAEDAGDVIL